MQPQFAHHDLRLLNPSFDSPLVDVLTELEHLRRLELAGDTPPQIFFQLKSIFHTLESLGSARIEGNHTTLADYIESKMEGAQDANDQLREISNIEHAMNYIDESMNPGDALSDIFIRELHALAVKDLEREGDKTPGAYRTGGVLINGAAHLPPDAIRVPEYMAALVEFINRPDQPKYGLMKVALAHHRFGWIHPFGNGNGRVVRLLTYALLIKYGFNVRDGGRVLNPAAVFCNDREKYYQMLSLADSGTEGSLEAWCIYVLQGILAELKKVDQLTNFRFLRESILLPALRYAEERHQITAMEAAILSRALGPAPVKAGDFSDLFQGMSGNQRTYQIKKLVDRNMLEPVASGARSYVACFANSFLLRGVMRALAQHGFISASLAGASAVRNVVEPPQGEMDFDDRRA
ncbi:Fic family protein [Pandoraea commovens]|uniref:Cell filamentation protein Fic n=1 Tax=Pandoraea commovens TaxID=2508289 RepID=A0A5E4TQT4_9BURK|nr:Fic family protein [Pandoraea commovens]UVA79540.1 Fic family protein [Pandoraea commovens]VVD89562.1 cell filamentation protein Fic [Pandoraea commovens]